MACQTRHIIGATPEDQINFGESIELILTYEDEAGPTNLTGATASIFASNPPVLKEECSVSVHDAAAGKIRMFLHRDHADKLRRGPNNWFRLQVIFSAESDDVTPEIFIQVT